jgi:hypothetical protein
MTTALSTPTSSAADLDLPPNWAPDETLKDDLVVVGFDYRHFRRITEAPHRYVVNITGAEPYVWDLDLKRPVPPMKPSSNGKPKKRRSKARYPRYSTSQTMTKPRKRPHRLRFRLNLGKTVGRKWPFLSRLICAAVYGAPPQSDSEAHHDNGNTLDNHWSNLHWRSPEANRAIERIRPERMRTQRSGAANSNSSLSFGQLFRLIQTYDDQQTSESDLAITFDISPAQVHRLVTAQSRTAEVHEIRWRLSAGAAHCGPAFKQTCFP